MPDIRACPQVGTLHQLILGHLTGADAERLEAHLALCSHCAEVLRQLPAEDTLVEAARGADTPGDSTPPDIVQALLPALKRLRPIEDAPTLVSDVPLAGPPTAADMSAASSDEEDELPPELRQLGPYRLLRRLGAGGMGVVYLAEDPRLQRQIALKLIEPGLLVRPDAQDRFLHEARAIAQVEHENILAVHEVEEANGVLFLAMPLLKGETLEARLQQVAGPLPIDDVLSIGRQIAAGLAAAHARQIIHRDIKPANIWLEIVGRESVGSGQWAVSSEEGADLSSLPTAHCPLPTIRVKILDFGLARAVQGAEPGLSLPGAIAGTPSYMSPEQARGLPIDGRADLFSLGCVLYRMATGKPAFAGNDLISLMMSAALDNPLSPRELNSEVPPPLSELILRLLAKSPEERLPSAEAAEAALRHIEQQRADAARPRPSRRRWLLVTAVAVLGAIGLTVWLLPPSVVPPEPVEVTFDFDAADPRLVLRRGDEPEIELDLARQRKHSLSPGDYAVRVVHAAPLRRLLPERILVKPEEPMSVLLCLVGEIRHIVCERAVTACALTPDKKQPRAVLASADGTVRCWDVAGDERAQVLVGSDWLNKNTEFSHGSAVTCLALSSDGKFALSASGDRGRRADLSIRLWDLRTRRQMAQFAPRDDSTWVTALAFAPDGRHFFAGHKNGTACFWDIPTHQPSPLLRAQNQLDVLAAAYAPDGKRLLTAGSDGHVLLWDPVSAALPRLLAEYRGAVRGIAFAPDGNHAASANEDGTVRLWDLRTETARTLVVHPEDPPACGVQAVAYSPDGERLLTGSSDGTLRLWETATGKHLYTLEGHTKSVTSVAFSADGRRALSGSADRTARWWELPR